MCRLRLEKMTLVEAWIQQQRSGWERQGSQLSEGATEG